MGNEVAIEVENMNYANIGKMPEIQVSLNDLKI